MIPPIRYAAIGTETYAARFILGIGENTKPLEFDYLCQLNPGYKLDNCSTCNAMGLAAERGNLNLISHLVKIGGIDLLNMGDHDGATALFWCIYRAAHKDNRKDVFPIVSEKAHFICPQLLCQLGVDVNLANTTGWGDNVIGDIPKDVTALWMAAEKTIRLDLVKMLMCYGGDENVCGPLSEQGLAMISKAKKEIFIDMFNENRDLLIAFNVLPNELRDLLIMTKLTAGKWGPFLLKV